MNIFVIVVTYKGHRWYERCFSSLRTSEIHIKTIVVDNASGDGTVEYIENNFPEIILIKSKKNLGFGQGNNLAIRYALNNAADYVFLLNQDAWIEPNTILDLIRVHQNNNDYGILSPIHIDVEKENIIPGFTTILNRDQNIHHSWISDLYFNKLNDVYEAKSLPAASWLLPISTVQTLGGFDPIFFHRGEDDNYLQRALYHSVKVGLCPKVRIVHDSFYSEEDLMMSLKTLDKRLILINVTDINQMSFNKYIVNLLKKIIYSVLKFRFIRIKISIMNTYFLISNRHAIISSRKTNIKKGLSWL